jgi:dihydroxyacetone kinase-like protein
MSITRNDVIRWIQAYAKVLAEKRDFLTELDSSIGDADHGANMNRGFQAVLTKLPAVEDKDIGVIFKTVGMTLLSTVGGASGPLYGSFFIEAGKALAGKTDFELGDWAVALEAGTNSIISRGKAAPGDKTMVDALTPAVQAIKDAARQGTPLPASLTGVAQAAEQGMKSTIPLIAKKGRASYLGERSAGHQDPGATSAYFLLQTAAETWQILDQ